MRLREEEDSLPWSKNKSIGLYTIRLGYKALMEEEG
jgi:hypothetical protein